MKLRNMPGIEWPPQWGRAYDRGEKFEIGETGGILCEAVLRGDEIHVVADFGGKRPIGEIRNQDKELLKRITKALQTKIGKSLQETGDVEVGQA